MSLSGAVRDALKGNATLVTLMTGGIFSHPEDLPGYGISFKELRELGTVYTGEVMKPVIVVREDRTQIAAGVHDELLQETSVRSVLNIELMQDAFGDRDTFETAKMLIMRVLQDRSIGHRRFNYIGSQETARTRELLNAARIRLTYYGYGVISPTGG